MNTNAAMIRKFNRRLLKLADHLSTLKRERFDYNCWVGAGWDGKPHSLCGTVACALGSAVEVPLFRKLGLQLFQGRLMEVGGFVGLKSDHAKPLNDRPRSASSKLFGLCDEAHYLLFEPFNLISNMVWNDSEEALNKKLACKLPDHDASPKRVAGHIRWFVKNRALIHQKMGWQDYQGE